MSRKLSWLALVAALAVPAAIAAAGDTKAGGAGKADAPSCCSHCCDHHGEKACPRSGHG
ncbi:MAG TPA: hypothetical protein VHR45_08865 [Thermoanaerobaculia bacterium]|nr:hypothetical protein [Thermoanaerobaculia bacterium]